MTSERSGNSPRGRRRGRPPGSRPQQPGGNATRGGQPHPHGAGGNRAGSGEGQRRAPGGAGQRPGGGYQRWAAPSSAAGWTTVRPWRPPRDDSDEPVLDDDTQPDWDALGARRPGRRPGGQGNTGAGQRGPGFRPQNRPPAWPNGNSRPANRPTGPAPRSRPGRAPRPEGQRRQGTWMPPHETED